MYLYISDVSSHTSIGVMYVRFLVHYDDSLSFIMYNPLIFFVVFLYFKLHHNFTCLRHLSSINV